VTGIFHEIVQTKTDFPSLLEAMDNLCMQNILQEEEKLSGELLYQRRRFLEMYKLLDRTVRGELARKRKFKYSRAWVRRWSAKVERYFLPGSGNAPADNRQEISGEGQSKE
jgi:hypothetical protein